MYFLNESEIDGLVTWCARRGSYALPYAAFLADWRDTVNSNSDGWAHWSAAPRAAERLMRALQNVRQGAAVEPATLKRSLAPIKACATRHGLKAPILAL